MRIWQTHGMEGQRRVHSTEVTESSLVPIYNNADWHTLSAGRALCYGLSPHGFRALRRVTAGGAAARKAIMVRGRRTHPSVTPHPQAFRGGMCAGASACKWRWHRGRYARQTLPRRLLFEPTPDASAPRRSVSTRSAPVMLSAAKPMPTPEGPAALRRAPSLRRLSHVVSEPVHSPTLPGTLVRAPTSHPKYEDIRRVRRGPACCSPVPHACCASATNLPRRGVEFELFQRHLMGRGNHCTTGTLCNVRCVKNGSP
jgi:hypothetical protein